MLSDKVRAAIALLIANVISGLVAFGVDLSTEQIAVANSIVNSTLIVIGLIFPSNAGTTTTFTPPADRESVAVIETGPENK